LSFEIFAGLRILDFSRVLAGPYATRVFADFGAEVIKVQTRATAVGADNCEQPYFAMWNRNKLGISLDMSFPEARSIALDLAAKSDVVVENFSPRVLDNWGLGYDMLRRANPGIILLRMSAAGQSGPWRNHVAFGPTIHALSGLTHLTSYSDEPPCGPGFAYADVAAGLYGALAVASALYSRAQSHEGQYIDLSEYETLVALLGPALIATHAGTAEDVIKSELTEAAPLGPCGCFRCLGDDQWCAIAIRDETQWHGLCDVLGLGALVDQRFNSICTRRQSLELHVLIESRTSQYRACELVERLQEKGIAASVVQSAAELADDPQLRHRNYFVRLKHPTLGEYNADRGPIRLGGDPAPNWRPAPQLGEHNDYVFGTVLGWNPTRIAELRRRGVIG
jgi:benzylsuccinate CoA-transferase BbsF subunit